MTKLEAIEYIEANRLTLVAGGGQWMVCTTEYLLSDDTDPPEDWWAESTEEAVMAYQRRLTEPQPEPEPEPEPDPEAERRWQLELDRTRAQDYLGLLRMMYVFAVVQQRSLSPWGHWLEVWRERVEELTGWVAFDEVERDRRNSPLWVEPWYSDDKEVRPAEPAPVIPGNWKIGSRCKFTDPRERGWLGCRKTGTVTAYDPATRVITITGDDGTVFVQVHTPLFGGISGTLVGDGGARGDAVPESDERQAE